MARHMRKDQRTVYRAVITESHNEGFKTYYRGPFTTKGAASAALTREKRYNRWRPTEVTGHVEGSTLVWHRVLTND